MIQLKFQDLNAKPETRQEEKGMVSAMDVKNGQITTVVDVLSSPTHLGVIEDGYAKHYYTRGSFDLVQLVFYILKQTGPANIFISTYGIAENTLDAIKRKQEKGDILSIRFLVDNRVRNISPKPFNHLVKSFPENYRCTSVHAKIALVWNDDWKISLVTSQNATHNPKLERGVIHTDPRIFTYDLEMLEHEFDEGTT